MNSAVEDQSGPPSMAEASWPIQLSPRSIDSELCCDRATVGVTSDTFGSLSFAASSRMSALETQFAAWRPLMHSANVGQISHRYPAVNLRRLGPSPEYSFQDSAAWSSRSMIVGTQR